MNSFLTKLPAMLLTGFLIMLAICSCKKDPYEIGVDLLPPSDTLNLRSTDTCTVQAFSVRQDSIRSDKMASLLLGSRMDPVFGKLTASFYSQVLLSSEGVDFGTHPVLDSLVLVLVYSNHYGDTLTRQNVKVYEINQDFPYDSVHYTNHHLNVYPTLLADQDYLPRVKDSVKVYSAREAPQLRINMSRLTNYLGNKILNAPTTALAYNVAFLNYLKGFYVEASPVNSEGAILNFSIASGNSRMVVYYHNGDDPADDSLHYDLPISTACARFTHVDHNGYLDAGQDLKQQILNHDSALGSQQLYLQGMAGVKVKVKFPYMKSFSQGKAVSINEAILEMKNYETDTTYAPPPTLLLLRQDSIGRIGNLADAGEGSAYFGGTYNTSTRTYSFRITQHMQKVLLNAYSNHFDLYMMVNSPIASSLSPNRVILTGPKPFAAGDHPNRFRLKVTYTVLH